jgi:FkbM family methyltransferase
MNPTKYFRSKLSLKEFLILAFLSVLNRLLNFLNRHSSFMRNYALFNGLSAKAAEVTENDDFEFVKFKDYSLQLRKKSSDRDVLKQIVVEEEYRIILEIAQLNNINLERVIDAGANIGLTTLYLANAFPSASLISIEPDHDNFKMLEIHTSTLKSKRILLHAGISGVDGVLVPDQQFRDGLSWSKTFKPANSSVDAATIPCYSISTLMNMHQWSTIDFLKIDIEGAERFIFDNSDADITFLKRVKLIAIEIHDEFLIREKINKILNLNGFVLFLHGELTIGVNSRM